MNTCTVQTLWSLGNSDTQETEYKVSLQRACIFYAAKNDEKNEAEDGYLRPVRIYGSDLSAFREGVKSSDRLKPCTNITAHSTQEAHTSSLPWNIRKVVQLTKRLTAWRTFKHGSFYKILSTIRDNAECPLAAFYPNPYICDLAAKQLIQAQQPFWETL